MAYGVIVIDDEYWIRNLICSYLPEENGVFALSGQAADGLDGLALCRKVQAEIVITDIKMPGMNGLELLEEIRKEFPDTQIIIVSGYEEFENARRALKSGVLDYLLKPIEEDALRDVLMRAAERLDNLNAGKQMYQKLRKKVKNLESILTPPQSLPEFHDQRIERATVFIQRHFNRDISLDETASEAGMNPNYFSECFKKSTGWGFHEYLTNCRIQKASKLLPDPTLKIADIARLSGFRDPNYFTRIFKKITGKKPSECRNLF